jgi:hypothetical protein
MMYLAVETEDYEVEGPLKPLPVLWFGGCPHRSLIQLTLYNLVKAYEFNYY